jgi:hypothetical protein
MADPVLNLLNVVPLPTADAWHRSGGYAACGIDVTMPRPGLCRGDQNEMAQDPQDTGLLARQSFNMRHSPEARDQSCLRKASNSSSGW